MIPTPAADSVPPSKGGRCTICGAPLPAGGAGRRTDSERNPSLCPKCEDEPKADPAEDARQERRERAKARSVARRDDNVLPFPAKFSDNGEIWEPWKTDKDLARHFQVSRSTIQRWGKEGMPSVLFSHSRRYRIGWAEKWLEQRRAKEG